jgi:hypothetical protein
VTPVERDQLVELARAVAAVGSNAMLLEPSGNAKVAGGYDSIGRAVELGQPFAVEVSPAVLAADGDSERSAQMADVLASEIRNCGYEPVVVESGRPGNRHVFARIADGRDLESLHERARELGFDVRKGHARIRPPLSPHPHGYKVSLVAPESIDWALRALSARPLAKHWLRLLREGVPAGSRSEATQSFLMAAVNAGKPQAWAWGALLDPRNQLGEKIRELEAIRGTREARRWFGRSWRHAVDYVRKNPVSRRSEVRSLICDAKAIASAAPFPGRAGTSDRAVLLAHLGIATSIGSRKWSASVRQIAEDAGINRPQR